MQLRNDKFLLNGFIRQIVLELITKNNSNNIIIIPKDVILLILDFYKLVFFTQIDCSKCNNFIFTSKSCQVCDGTGITHFCHDCNGDGLIKSMTK